MADLYVCSWCGQSRVVPSLVTDCERRHVEVSENRGRDKPTTLHSHAA